jgi:hypothetical protein
MCQMFCLTDADFNKKILDFPAGISSFNMQAYERGQNIISADSLYSLDFDALTTMAEKILRSDQQQLETLFAKNLIHNDITVDDIMNDWQKSTADFLSDFVQGKKEGRYVAAKLPELPFHTNQFDLALCSDLVFHTKASAFSPAEVIAQLCRVAEEVRVFPLLDESGEISSELGPLMLTLQQKNFGIEVKEVTYKKRTGGNALLRLWAKECKV